MRRTSTTLNATITTSPRVRQLKQNRKAVVHRQLLVCTPLDNGILDDLMPLAVVDPQIAPLSLCIDAADQDMRMIGDFDGGANALWTLYRNEAKSYDEAHIQTLKDDMDGVLIFVRTYSAHVYGQL